MDKISVIVPVYNVENYLERCIESIITQTHKNLEIILVDDGSTDKSGEICDTFSDDRITVIHKENEGLGLARNSGLEVATGKYVMFVDSDDFLDSNMIHNLYADLISVGADTCIGGFKRIYDNNRIVEETNPLAGRIIQGNEILTEVLARMFGKANERDYLEMSVWKVLFSRQIIATHKIKFPSERKYISEDIIFDTEYYPQSQKVIMSHDTGYNYCDNEGSLTTKYNPNRFRLQINLYKELLSRANSLQIIKQVKDRLDTTLVAIARYSIKLEVKYANRNGLDKMLSNIKAICNDTTLNNVLSNYDDRNLGVGSRIIDRQIRNSRILSLVVIMTFKNVFNV